VVGVVHIAGVGTEASLNSGFSRATAGTRLISVIQYLIQFEIECQSKPELLQVNPSIAAPSTYPPLSAWNM
jgi:hypothetical protein